MAQSEHSRPSDQDTSATLRQLADQAFSRAAGAPLVKGNSVRILKDAKENYPAWLDAIRSARRNIHFESYIIHEDDVGREFADALLAKAADGVRVRLIYDWMGALGKTSRRFWQRLLAGGVEVRGYNPPRFDSPLGWISRDHRKMISVDGEVGFVTGLCVGRMWVGYPERNIDPWRDTGVEVRGPAVADIERAFAQVWKMSGGVTSGDGPVVPDETAPATTGRATAPAGDIPVRVIATVPNTAGLFRLDQLVAALARKRLWLTDAYYAGTTPYVQALRAAAKDGVDVRLLVPGGTDIPVLRPLSRSGYRTLLDAGIRIFEWNGPMLHAKTGVADGRWSRVGSTNLNMASWLGNYELDVMVEDERFARDMEEMYINDLNNATELVLDEKQKLRAPGAPKREQNVGLSGERGSAGRVAAGALRISNTIGAAISNRRVLEPIEARLMRLFALLLIALAALIVFFPPLLAYPLGAIAVWIAIVLLLRSYKMRRQAKRESASQSTQTISPAPAQGRRG